MTQQSPLKWPAGQARTRNPATAAFKMDLLTATEHLMGQLGLMGARYIVISSNLEYRQDGIPYARQKIPADRAVAVYFQWRGKQMTFACDRWDRPEHNIRAIGKTIEAIRGIERWGASEMMERAFSAFEALPTRNKVVVLSCWQILDIAPHSPVAEIDRAYRAMAKAAHPDRGGTRTEWDALQAAYEQAKKDVTG